MDTRLPPTFHLAFLSPLFPSPPFTLSSSTRLSTLPQLFCLTFLFSVLSTIHFYPLPFHHFPFPPSSLSIFLPQHPLFPIQCFPPLSYSSPRLSPSLLSSPHLPFCPLLPLYHPRFSPQLSCLLTCLTVLPVSSPLSFPSVATFGRVEERMLVEVKQEVEGVFSRRT